MTEDFSGSRVDFVLQTATEAVENVNFVDRQALFIFEFDFQDPALKLRLYLHEDIRQRHDLAFPDRIIKISPFPLTAIVG